MGLKRSDPASFKRTYTDAQREAVLDAHLRLGMSMRAIAVAAKAGTLPDPMRPGETMPAFSMVRQTIANVIRKAGTDYRAFLLQDNRMAEAAIDRIQGRTVQALEAKLRDFQDRERAGEEITVNQWKELASAATAARRLIRPPKPKPPGPGEIEPTGPSHPTGRQGSPDVLKRMGV